VHVCDINRAALDRLRIDAPSITGSMADAAVAADVDLVFADLQVTLGGLDVLINNASISGPTVPIESIDAAGWERTVAVNLNSQYYFARRAVPMLQVSPASPCLIAIGPVGGGGPSHAFRTPHVSTRWAVVGLVKALAIELGPHGIRVNAILPGSFNSERMRGGLLARSAAVSAGDEVMSKEYVNEMSPRRTIAAADVAALALFLCSPAARNLTGQAISVDGQREHHR